MKLVRGRVQKVCLGCSGSFPVMYCRQQRKFCSHACYAASSAGRYHRKPGQTVWNRGIKIDRVKYPAMGHWKNGKPKCLDCGITVAHYEAKRCRRCSHMSRLGPNHPRWTGGLSQGTKRLVLKRINGGSHNLEEWQRLCARFGKRCVGCGLKAKLEVDHIVPLVKGGTDSIDNLQPLCRSCNARKSVQTINYLEGAMYREYFLLEQAMALNSFNGR
jgi:5-methylcytosine-specific restriction endonuclease McrA